MSQSLIKELKTRIEQLETAIRKHRDEKGHDRCWLDDAELYSVLPENQTADFKLPPCDEFITHCVKYWQLRQPR